MINTVVRFTNETEYSCGDTNSCTVERSYGEDLDIWTMVSQFEDFLRGCGYVFKEINITTGFDVEDTNNG